MNAPAKAVVEITGAGIDAAERLWLIERTERALALIAAPIHRVSIRIVGDAEMIELHRRSMGDATTTDVLSWVEQGAAGALEADLAICSDEAARQAAERGHGRRDELLLYAVHGVLHAAGRDDRTPDDYASMHAEEARILEAIGGHARVTPEQSS